MADLFTSELPDIAAQLASYAISLPLQQSDSDAPTIVDASGRDVFTVDVNGDRPDDEAEGIALFLMNAINALVYCKIKRLDIRNGTRADLLTALAEAKCDIVFAKIAATRGNL